MASFALFDDDLHLMNIFRLTVVKLLVAEMALIIMSYDRRRQGLNP